MVKHALQSAAILLAKVDFCGIAELDAILLDSKLQHIHHWDWLQA